jgi:hypothetical protein
MQPDDGAPKTAAPADDYYYYTEDGYYYELARRPGVGSEGPRQEACAFSIVVFSFAPPFKGLSISLLYLYSDI